ncbi:MAG: S8/S53 family peptidase [Actinomycetota bacterium]|nr:S8/S53 family peptidase [Actinomycetota bacterium]
MAMKVARAAAETVSEKVEGLILDNEYPAVQQPGLMTDLSEGAALEFSEGVTFSLKADEAAYVMRGEIPDEPKDQADAIQACTDHPEVEGVFSDPVIETSPVCGGDAPQGTADEVGRLLDTQQLQKLGMEGQGVYAAVVDTGINLQHIVARGLDVELDAAHSWTPPSVSTQPGTHPVDHGTMCAYDVAVVAPRVRLLDHAVLLSQAGGETVMSGLLSDAVLAYAQLQSVLSGMEADKRALVVSNSWGMYDPRWDFPIGHPGNYSHNPRHPFNIIVQSLVSAGADVLFAAGNCGRDCPDDRCGYGQDKSISGANSLPAVLCVAGSDVNKNRVGYSSQGPGTFDARKPDLSAYTHFAGSGVWEADSGTSAACPVLAGYVAAIRSRHPSSEISPMQLRSLLYKTAEDMGGTGYDFDHGWGLPNTQALLAKLS